MERNGDKAKTFGRCGLFFDGENVSKTTKNRNWTMGLRELLVYVRKMFPLEDLKSYYYLREEVSPTVEKVQFIFNIKMSGFILKFVEPYFKINQSTGNVEEVVDLDLECMLDMCLRIDNFDTFILVTGDGDFDRFVKRALDIDKKIIIIAGSNVSYLFKENHAITVVNIEKQSVREEIIYKP